MLYGPARILATLEEAGCESLECLDADSFAPLTLESRRMIVIGKVRS